MGAGLCSLCAALHKLDVALLGTPHRYHELELLFFISDLPDLFVLASVDDAQDDEVLAHQRVLLEGDGDGRNDYRDVHAQVREVGAHIQILLLCGRQQRVERLLQDEVPEAPQSEADDGERREAKRREI